MNIKNILGKAQVLFQKGNYKESSALCLRLLEKKPKIADVLHLLALNFKAMEQPEQAIVEFKKAIGCNDKVAIYYNNLANTLLEAENFSEAGVYFEKALTLDPLLSATNHNFSVCLLRQGQLHSAAIYCKKALLQDAVNPDYNITLGAIYYELGLFDNAAKAYMLSLENSITTDTKTNSPEAYLGMFKLQVSQHHYRDAIEVADLGIASQKLTDQQICTLLIGKAIIYFLFSHFEEAKHAISLSEKIYEFTGQSKDLTNMTVFHRYIKALLKLRYNGSYQHLYPSLPIKKNMYFISESHGFAPNETLINYKNEQYKIKSLFVMGAKIIHLIADNDNKFQVSLSSLLETLEPGSKVVIAFGEIDCRLDQGIYPHSLKYNKNYNDVIEDMLSKYISLLNNIATSLKIEIIVYGVPSPNPCIFENYEKDTELSFINMIKCFNEQLRKECLSKEITFLDVYQLTDDNGKSNLEHHIDSYHVSPTTVPSLFEAIR